MASSWFIKEDTNCTFDSLKYSKINSEPTCKGIREVCAIYASEKLIDGTARPVIDKYLLREIVRALYHNKSTNAVKLKD
ncbi:MAG: hypothetical protein JEZ09_18410 [Salinivirgaceae bacterium]|nr:hypothetical protein [Salinivirgaceae bacterium]